MSARRATDLNTRDKQLLIALTAACAVALVLVRKILVFNPATYVFFADARRLLGIPHFWNVITNLPFLVVGLWALSLKEVCSDWLKATFAGALIGTAFGSAYFHAAPSPARLFWDQLPMSVGFASFTGVLIADRISRKLAVRVTPPLILFGAVSVWNIYYGTLHTQPYLSLQFGSLLFGLGLAGLRPKGKIPNLPLATGLLAYIAAKGFEAFDRNLYTASGMSGHAIKHMVAGAGLAVIIWGFKKR